jgi:7-keto-8-aminopelargonate synthetase-like enzyme
MTLPEPLQQIDRTWVQWRGQTLAYFGGCDYFRMASHPEVLAAARDAIDQYGLNVAASRWTTGNHILYNQLETAIADFFEKPALLVSNGYLTNTAVIQGLKSRITHLLIDERSHSSLSDAAKACANVIQFKHRDPQDLARKIPANARALIMTDGVFSQNGTLAPLREYKDVMPKDAFLLVDDSHGAAVIGANGRGVPEFFGVKSDRLIQTITLSKAIGAYGGAVLATAEICQAIADNCPLISGATPFPLPCAAAALVSLRLLKNPEPRVRLQENTSRVRANLDFPIVSVTPKNKTACDHLRAALLARGIFPSHIRYQHGPPEGYFRFAISSQHSRAQLDALAAGLPPSLDARRTDERADGPFTP